MKRALVFALFCLFALPVRAQDSGYVHIVRAGETLASIAQSYYGDPKRESVLVAENGLTDQGGSAIVEGLRLVIPTVRYHKVQAGDTWRDLSLRYYGDANRVAVLLRANDSKPGNAPDEAWLHGLCELVERDAETMSRHAGDAQQAVVDVVGQALPKLARRERVQLTPFQHESMAAP